MSMSWLWGGNKRPVAPENFTDFVPPAAAGGGTGDDDGKKSGAMAAYQFDSSALERAAKCAKDLENNPNALHILEMSKLQEIARGKEFDRQKAEYEMQTRQLELQGEKVRGEERMKQLREQANLDKHKVQYQDQLARQRYDEQIDQQRKLSDETNRRQEESVQKQEAIRRASFEQEMEKRAASDLQRMEKKIIMKGKVERENQDLKLEQIRLEQKENRETKLESIKSYGAIMATGANALLGDKDRLQLAVGGVVAVAAGIMASKYSLSVVFRYFEARLMKPVLIRETSRITLLETFKHPINMANNIARRFKGSQDPLMGVILKPEVEAAIRDIALGTRNSRQAKGFYRNVLLFGPPGTGKTLFATKLSTNSGMDYAIMTGGDVQLMGGDAVDAIHKLFSWAQTSRRGLILFIDEVESFLTHRTSTDDQLLKYTLSAFLSNTGAQSNKFMMVLTTNLPKQIDTAVLSRVHDVVEFGLPGLDERTRLIGQFFEDYILKPAASGKWRIKVEDKHWTETCKEVARLTEGLSGRELGHLALDWQMKTVVTESGELTRDLMIDRTKLALERKAIKEAWTAEYLSEKSPISSAVVAAAKQAVKDQTASPSPSVS